MERKQQPNLTSVTCSYFFSGLNGFLQQRTFSQVKKPNFILPFFFLFHFCNAASARVVFQSVGTAEPLQAGYYQHVGNEAQLQLISTRRRGGRKKEKKRKIPKFCHFASTVMLPGVCRPETSCISIKGATLTAQVQASAFIYSCTTDCSNTAAGHSRWLSEVDGGRGRDLEMNHPTAAAGSSDWSQLRPLFTSTSGAYGWRVSRARMRDGRLVIVSAGGGFAGRVALLSTPDPHHHHPPLV